METKTVLQSKTVLFNILTLLAISLTAVSDSSIVTDNPVAVGVVSVIVAVVNVGLRLVTKTAISK